MCSLAPLSRARPVLLAWRSSKGAAALALVPVAQKPSPRKSTTSKTRRTHGQHRHANFLLFSFAFQTLTVVCNCCLKIRLIVCASVSPVLSSTNACAVSDHPSLKLVVSAEIQICRTGEFGLITKRVSSLSSNRISSFPAPPSTSKSCSSPSSVSRLRKFSSASSDFFWNSRSSILGLFAEIEIRMLQPCALRFCVRLVLVFRLQLQLLFDLLLQLASVYQADEALHDFPVARNQHAGGQSDQPAEFLGQIFIAYHDWIAHFFLRVADFELRILHKGLDHFFSFRVHGHTQNRESLVFVFIFETDHPRNLFPARVTPRRPEIHEHHFPF